MKLWGGRFQKQTSEKLDDFHSSIHFDCRLAQQDVMGSIAHVKMLGKQQIIPLEESELIAKTLGEILVEVANGEIEFDVSYEDIHMNIEKILIDRIGEVGKKLHTGRSRNDQVALDARMYTKQQIIDIQDMLYNLIFTLVNMSEEHLDTIMPGFTHLQKAQPITFAHHLMAYVEMFKRDFVRLHNAFDSTDVMPLGSAALAGTTYPLDRQMVADELGFASITLNSLDAVSDRDFMIELISALSMLMMHLSRFCEEIILWASSEYAFIELDDAYSTGSSIMPQKKNPDIAELIRGKSGRVYGHLMGLLTVMKGLPLAYNKDLQEDKETLFDAVDTVKMCLPIFTEMLATMTVQKENMYASTQKGFTNATDAADYLVKKGIPFREAHEIIGKLVFYCVEHKKDLSELTLEEYQQISVHFEQDIYQAIDLYTCVNERKTVGGPAKEAVTLHIQKTKEFFTNQKNAFAARYEKLGE